MTQLRIKPYLPCFAGERTEKYLSIVEVMLQIAISRVKKPRLRFFVSYQIFGSIGMSHFILKQIKVALEKAINKSRIF